jgi:hypothetical protein
MPVGGNPFDFYFGCAGFQLRIPRDWTHSEKAGTKLYTNFTNFHEFDLAFWIRENS